jgi:hypothetical protein
MKSVALLPDDCSSVDLHEDQICRKIKDRLRAQLDDQDNRKAA